MPAFRITYEISKGDLSIKSAVAVGTRVPPSAPDAALDTGVGTWVEVRDAGGTRIWGRVLDETLLAGEARVQRGDGAGTMTRVRLESLTERVLVPAADGGRVAFMHRAESGEKARTLAERKL